MKTATIFSIHIALLLSILASCDYINDTLGKEDVEYTPRTFKKVNDEELSREEDSNLVEEEVNNTDDPYLRRSLEKTNYIKDNVIWENLNTSGIEDLSALYFVGWYNNKNAAFVTSRESSECGGLSSKLFIQNIVTDSILNSYNMRMNCEHGYWMPRYSELHQILNANNIKLSRNPSISLNEDGGFSDTATNKERESYRIDIQIDEFNVNKEYTATATSPNGKQKVIGHGYSPYYKDYQYAGYVQSPDKSRIAVVLRAYRKVSDRYLLSEPIIMGCKLDEDTF